MKILPLALIAAGCSFVPRSPAHAQLLTLPYAKFAWAENIGYLNFRDAGAPAGSAGLRVFDTYLSGFVWSENAGWINLGNSPANGVNYANTHGTNFGVNLDPSDGYLSGFAWSENAGWINFSGGALASPPIHARIAVDAPRRFYGYAWSENLGWINFDDDTTSITIACLMDYNQDSFLNLDDLGDFITDFYTSPPIPGGNQPFAPAYAGIEIGFGVPCPAAAPAPLPYAADAYTTRGYRVGYSSDGSNACPLAPQQPFPNLDNLNDFITDYYTQFGQSGC